MQQINFGVAAVRLPDVDSQSDPSDEHPNSHLDADDAAGQCSDGNGEHRQIDGLDALALPKPAEPRKACVVKHSQRHMELLWQGRDKRHQQRREQKLEDKSRTSEAKLDLVTALLPGAASILGQQRTHSKIGKAKVGKLVSEDLALVVKAMFLPSSTKLKCGVTHGRILCAGALLTADRQVRGLQRALDLSHSVLSCMSPDKKVCCQIHVGYIHAWDEIEAKFKLQSAFNLQGHGWRVGVATQTMMQRGLVAFTMSNSANNTCGVFAEAWLLPAKEIDGTAAEHIVSGILTDMPQQFNFEKLDQIRDTLDKVGSFTNLMLGDRATGNVLGLHYMGAFWEYVVLPVVGPRALFWPDLCGVHLHHRSKLQVKPLKFHTMRHFGIANLNKHVKIRLSQINKLGAKLETCKMSRITRAAPLGQPTLYLYVDILFDFNASHHQRKNGSHSQRWQDLHTMCSMINNSILDPSWIHFCHDAETGRPCCRNLSECRLKTRQACSNCLYGSGDPIPAESTWTHTLSNFKQTLIRRGVRGLGIDAFTKHDIDVAVQEISIDGEAVENFKAEVKKTRVGNTEKYYRDDRNFHELGVIAIMLDVCDSHLMYSTMGDFYNSNGDPKLSQQKSKMDKLLHKDTSEIGQCFQELLRLLQHWLVGGATRRPWMILDVLQAPVRDPKFIRWSRSQIMRLTSALFRRFEQRMSCWPFPLYAYTFDSGYTADEYNEVGKELVGTIGIAPAARKWLDVYAYGIQKLFPNLEALASHESRALLTGDFKTHPFGIDLVERLNSLLTGTAASHGTARNLVIASREHLLKQVANVHQANGGCNPLSTDALALLSSEKECIRCMPILTEPHGKLGICTNPPQLEDQNSASSESMSTTVAPPMPTVAGFSTSADITHVTIERTNPGLCKLVKHESDSSGDHGRPRKKGLNPFLLELNKRLHAFRLLKGHLTDAEATAFRESFREEWDAMEDHTPYQEAYRAWEPGEKSTDVEKIPEYAVAWGGGCSSNPFTKEEFHEYIQRKGWPSQAVIDDTDGSQRKVVSDSTRNIRRGSDFNLWGIGRRAHNIDRDELPQINKFDMVEKGLLNYIDHIGKEAVDFGDVLIIIDGTASVEVPLAPATKRIAAFISGTCYSPKVFDALMVNFENLADQSEAIPLPCEVQIAVRANRVTPKFLAMDIVTSDEFIRLLVEKLVTMELRFAHYEPIIRDDGIMWSRIHGVDLIGTLWRDGQEKPLLYKPATTSVPKLRTSNPMSATPPSRVTRTSRRGGRARTTAVRDGPTDPVDTPCPAVVAGASSVNSLDPARSAPALAVAAYLDAGEDDGVLGEWSDSDCGEVYDAYADPAVSCGACDDTPPSISGFGATDPIREACPAVIDFVTDQLLDDLEPGAPNIINTCAASGSSSASNGCLPSPGGHDIRVDPIAPYPWDVMTGPDFDGNCWIGSRRMMCIQRNKPKNSVTVNCYRPGHSGCSLLIGIGRCPEDIVLKRWLFEVPEGPEGPGSSAEAKRLAMEHMDLGRARWYVNKRKRPEE